jgi:periplasmic protein TonB
MPGTMFQDVVCPRAHSNRKWYTLPLSFLVHTLLVLVLIVVPLIATDTLPRPRSLLQFVTPFIPAMPSPPPVRSAARSNAVQSTTAAPVVAPMAIGVESGVTFEPADVETGGIEDIAGTIDVGQIAIDAPPPVQAEPSGPLSIGSNIKRPVRTKYLPPHYPDLARSAKVEGVVIIEAIIGTDGKVNEARVLRSQPLLDEAALTAVRAWEYTPTLLNNRPVPVIMTITVQFSLR